MSSPGSTRPLGECNAIKSRLRGEAALTFGCLIKDIAEHIGDWHCNGNGKNHNGKVNRFGSFPALRWNESRVSVWWERMISAYNEV
jgi:hypothetical protein